MPMIGAVLPNLRSIQPDHGLNTNRQVADKDRQETALCCVGLLCKPSIHAPMEKRSEEVLRLCSPS